jgi:hypothetical protein
MDMIQRKQRAAVSLQMKEIMLQDIFENQKKYQKQEMAEIALQNKQLLGLSMATFMFKGKWYCHPWNTEIPRDTAGMNRTLDKSLYAEANAILTDDTADDLEAKAQITSMINNALGLCRTLDCLKNLLPTGIWDVSENINTLAKTHFDVGSPLTPEEIETFNKQNNIGMTSIKRLYMLELLLARD